MIYWSRVDINIPMGPWPISCVAWTPALVCMCWNIVYKYLFPSAPEFSWSEIEIGRFCGVFSVSDKEHVVSASSATCSFAASESDPKKWVNDIPTNTGWHNKTQAWCAPKLAHNACPRTSCQNHAVTPQLPVSLDKSCTVMLLGATSSGVQPMFNYAWSILECLWPK